MPGVDRQDAARLPPQSLAKEPWSRHVRAIFPLLGRTEMSTALRETIHGLIEPFNKKGVELTDATTFAGDLEWDSLTVMDFVAEVEDSFDIIISMNMQAEIENVGQLIAAVEKLQG
jgi:acyl carrier protein